MADRDAWEKAESLSKIFAAVSIPVVLGVASLLANQALEKSKTRDELLKQPIDVVFLSKSDQMAGADKSLESRSPFKPTSYPSGGLAIGSKVFISYRRGDSAAYAGRVWDRLERDLGRHFLFMDVAAIPLGTNFPKVLHEEVAKCGVLLAMIGPNWLDARDEHGNRRLDDPNDFVRIEIAQALQRDIPVIPILLDGATIPKADQLPKDLKELASRNGMHILHASFHDDMDRLIRELKGQLDQAVSSDERTAADAQQSDPAVAQGAHSLKVLRGQPIRRHDLQSARRVGQTKPEPPMGGKNSVNQRSIGAIGAKSIIASHGAGEQCRGNFQGEGFSANC